MKKQNLIIILILAILVLLGGFAYFKMSKISVDNTLNTNEIVNNISSGNEQLDNQEGNVNINDWSVYRDKEYGFEVKYPNHWSNKNNEAITFFASGGPVGDMFGFLAADKTIYNNPFWVYVYIVPNIQYDDELKYFDFAHKGDRVVYDDYDIVNLGDEQENFYKIQEKNGSFLAYIKIRNGNYYEINFIDPHVESLKYEAEEVIKTFRFID